MKFNTLKEWLDWQEKLHPSEIDMGLERMTQVLENMLVEFFASTLDEPLPFTLVTVSGTNGKGTTVGYIEAICVAAGYKTGCYTSPHFLQYNERIRINAELIDDHSVCQAFERINWVRQNISLTFFEFSTLAAIYLFFHYKCDVAIMEVGMGGLTDAVNVLNPQCSIVTTVAIDHQAWLGNDIESIGLQKSGIYRNACPAIYGDLQAPKSLVAYAGKLEAEFIQFGKDFAYQDDGDSWQWYSHVYSRRYIDLPKPSLFGQMQLKNASNAIMALTALAQQLPRIDLKSIKNGLQSCRLTGRCQCISHNPEVIVDVAHNPQAAESLAGFLQQQPCAGKTHAIFAILADKDAVQVVKLISQEIDNWHLIELNVARSLGIEKTANIVSSCSNTRQPTCYNNFHSAYQSIVEKMSSLEKQQDRIIVFGSFYTVSCALEHFAI